MPAAIQIRAIRTVLIIVCLTGGAAEAHEFWIAPESGRVATGAEVAGDLMVGIALRGEPYPYLSDRFQRFTVTAGGETTDLPGFEGDIPALSYVAERPGLQVIAHHTIAFRATHDDWAVFQRYLDEEGLGEFAGIHRARGLPETGFAERYTRCAKALVQVGPADPEDRDAPVGMPLELVAEANPYAPGTEVLPVTLTWQGAPLAGRQISIFRDDGAVTRTIAVTDEAGRARIPVRGAGDYLLSAVHLEPRDAGPVVWESHWASLSFKLARAQ